MAHNLFLLSVSSASSRLPVEILTGFSLYLSSYYSVLNTYLNRLSGALQPNCKLQFDASVVSSWWNSRWVDWQWNLWKNALPWGTYYPGEVDAMTTNNIDVDDIKNWAGIKSPTNASINDSRTWMAWVIIPHCLLALHLSQFDWCVYQWWWLTLHDDQFHVSVSVSIFCAASASFRRHSPSKCDITGKYNVTAAALSFCAKLG